MPQEVTPKCRPEGAALQRQDAGLKARRYREDIAGAEEFVGFGGGDAGVGGEAVEVVEAIAGGPGCESGFALFGEMLLEAGEWDAGVGIARGDGAAGAGVAALEGDIANGEADDVAFVIGEELVFPEGGDAIYFQSGAKAKTDVVERERREPFGDSLEGGG